MKGEIKMDTTNPILDHIDKYVMLIGQKINSIAPEVITIVKQRLIAEFEISVTCFIFASIMTIIIIYKDIHREWLKDGEGDTVYVSLSIILPLITIVSMVFLIITLLHVISLDYSAIERILKMVR